MTALIWSILFFILVLILSGCYLIKVVGKCTCNAANAFR